MPVPMQLLYVIISAFLFQGGGTGPVVRPIDRQGLHDLIRSDSGNVVLVNAWASWCKPCIEEMPALVRLARKYRKQKFSLILVAIDDPDKLDSEIRPMLTRAGVDFPSFILQGTPDDEFINTMNSSWSGALPATFCYNPGGTQVAMLVGGKPFKKFDSLIAPFFRKPGARPVTGSRGS